MPQHDYFLCGWRVVSELPLPELTPWTGGHQPAHMTIRLGNDPRPLETPIQLSPTLQISADGSALLTNKEVATYALSRDHHVLICPHSDRDNPKIRVYLLGTIFGLICLRRGLFPLHASCVRIGGRAVAFAGPSAAGKSTLAAALTQRGHQLLADDVCVIDANDPARPMVLPAFPRSKLWEDAASAIKMPPDAPLQQRKFHFRFAGKDQFTTQPTPLHAVFLLAEPSILHPSRMWSSHGPQAVAALSNLVYRQRAAAIWGLKPNLFQMAAAIANSAAIVNWLRPRDLSQLDKDTAFIEAFAMDGI